MEETSLPANSTPIHAESFYFDDDPMAIFLVEDQLFKVHRHYFIQGSEIFRDMFFQAKNCENVATVAEGMSDEKPIVLSQVTVKEFKTLLRFFYAMTLPIPNKKTLADILAFEQDEKLALLSIAHQFVFDTIFEYICGELEPDEIPVTILERNPDENMSKEEAGVLGIERVVKVLEAKNRALHKARPRSNRANLGCNHQWYCDFCRTMTTRINEEGSDDVMGTAIAQEVANLMGLQ